jgi:drug/metabolite transporter (DMT)-like permease
VGATPPYDGAVSPTIPPMPHHASQSTAPVWQSALPGVFVLLWATGFFAGKLGLEYAAPFTFLEIRFAIATLLMLALALVLRAPWPHSRTQMFHVAVVGVLLQAVYLGGSYAAMAAGIPTGVTALIVGLQPILTATLVGPLLGERVSARQWLGLGIGFSGVALVLEDKLHFDSLQMHGVLYALCGLLGITIATIYQKRFCSGVDLRTGAVIQYGAATLAVLPVAYAAGFHLDRLRWTAEFVGALAWLVLVLSLGTFTLLLWLLRRGVASKVASLFYLTPPVVALGGFFMFGETLGLPALAGMAMTAVGVALVNRG